ncbi:hypothetical protein SRABI106_03581 [Rahnella aquatilis]|nr:hypothetical protein SRABI106_03581 [Rahnella aquatilis]
MVGSAAPRRPIKIIEAKEASTPEITKTVTLVLLTGTPATRAASSLPPTARIYSPSGVLFITVQSIAAIAITITIGAGTPKIVLLMTVRNSIGIPKIGLPLVKISASARNSESPPRVTINGCKPAYATSMPLNTPHSAPTPSVAIIASGTGTPDTISVAPSTAESAAVGPTERSIPPEIMTSVIPSAIIPLMEDCCNILSKLGTVKNTGDKKEKVITIITKPISVPASRTLNLNNAEGITLG